MTEWWTYRPSDFLLFSPRTYYRLFELYNADLWPAQPVVIVVGLALWLALLQDRAWAPRVAGVFVGAAWLWVAWAFHWQRFVTINWAATWFAGAFALEGVLLWAWAGRDTHRPAGAAKGQRRRVGLALLLFGLLLQPAVGPLVGRPWTQVEVFGLAPDPTALGSLGLLLWLRARGGAPTWWLWPIPLAWCATSGITLATMHAGDAWLLPAAASATVLSAWLAGHAGAQR